MNERTVDVYTPCRDCIFAMFDEQVTRQIDCKVGRLDKFQSMNKVQEIEDEDTALRYYRITTICNMIRNSEWAMDKENPEQKAREQIRVKAGLILLDKKNDELLIDSIRELSKQSLKPSKIVITTYRRESSWENILKELRNIDIKFEVLNVFDSDDNGNLINHAVRKLLNTHYYIVQEAGVSLGENFINKLDCLTNDELMKISMVEPTNGITGLAIQTHLHEMLGGYDSVTMPEKIKKLAEMQNLEKMIINYDEVGNVK